MSEGVETEAQALGRAIAVARVDRGLKRKPLADLAGISYPYLSEIENGNKVASANVMRRIAEALGTTHAELLRDAQRRLEEEGVATAAAPREPEERGLMAWASPAGVAAKPDLSAGAGMRSEGAASPLVAAVAQQLAQEIAGNLRPESWDDVLVALRAALEDRR